MDYLMVQRAALDMNNILDIDTKVNYHCTPKTGRKCDRAESCVGGFCVAFPMNSNRGGTKRCYRIWFVDNVETLRFEEIADHVTKRGANLRPYIVNYTYIPKAMKVENRFLPGVKMEWIEGQKLNKYIETHNDPETIKRLAESFLKMCKLLCENKVAHGDLSNSNILVTHSGELRLIDYDSVYVPSMGNEFYQTTAGQPSFQHPERGKKPNLMSYRDDYFSQQVIYLSLLAIARNPQLISCISDEELLFTAYDLQSFDNYKNSNGYNALKRINDPFINLLSEELGRSISGPLNKVKSIVEIIYADRDTSVPVKHRIRIQQPNNIIKIATYPMIEACAGESITITCVTNKPDEYIIKGINVITSNGVWRLGNQRNFQMPDSDVILEAEFEKITHDFKQLNYCSKCGTKYYKSYSRYCHHCGEKR